MRICKYCGKVLVGRHPAATRCLDCAAQRVGGHVRNGGYRKKGGPK